MRTVLGVDSSTQATKVEVRDVETGHLLAFGRAPHAPTSPPVSEQDPMSWLAALHAACGNGRVDIESVDAISIAGQQHGMVVLDEHDNVLRPAKLWNDTESAPDAAWLVEQIDAGQWASRCGSVPLAAFTIAKLSWMQRSEPDVWARVARVCLPHDWLTLQLTGEFVTDRGDASGTGYWSPRQGRYALDLLAIVDERRDWLGALPRVCDLGEAMPSRRGRAVVASGTGDNMAAALGVALNTGQVVVSLGTSGTVYARSVAPTADASGNVAGFADATGAFLPLVCTLNATRVTDTVSTLLGCDRATFEGLAREATDAGSVCVVPYFAGERTPNLPSATGLINGVRTNTTREQVALAAFQGVVCGILDGITALVEAGVAAGEELVLIGGGAKSGVYRQVLADLSQRVVHVPDGDEHVALGACVQAAATLQQCTTDEVADAWSLGNVAVTVDPSISRDAADAVRARYALAAALATK